MCYIQFSVANPESGIRCLSDHGSGMDETGSGIRNTDYEKKAAVHSGEGKVDTISPTIYPVMK
jgi:hypothetical protein